MKKTPIYRVHKKKVSWYDYNNKKIDKKYYEFLETLNKPRSLTKIKECAGIYGIFYKNKCLYVGQSFNIKRRIQQHKQNYKKAKKHINSVKRIRKLKVEYKYYQLARKYKLSQLSFKTIKVITKPDLLNLTYAEQYYMDLYKPKLNYISARPTIMKSN